MRNSNQSLDPPSNKLTKTWQHLYLQQGENINTFRHDSNYTAFRNNIITE